MAVSVHQVNQNPNDFTAIKPVGEQEREKLTANDVERTTGHVREEIDPVTVVGHHVLVGLFQFLDQHNALLVEDVDKIFQDLEVECRS